MSNESGFDPSQFLDATTQEALVKRPPLPAGSVFLAEVGEPKVRTWQSNKPEAKVKSGVAIDLPIILTKELDPSLPADRVTLTPGIMLDLTEAGLIDWSSGKNGGLRRWREALNMNTPGEPFSIRQMQGRQVKVSIKHRIYEGETYDEIDSPVKA